MTVRAGSCGGGGEGEALGKLVCPGLKQSAKAPMTVRWCDAGEAGMGKRTWKRPCCVREGSIRTVGEFCLNYCRLTFLWGGNDATNTCRACSDRRVAQDP